MTRQLASTTDYRAENVARDLELIKWLLVQLELFVICWGGLLSDLSGCFLLVHLLHAMIKGPFSSVHSQFSIIIFQEFSSWKVLYIRLYHYLLIRLVSEPIHLCFVLFFSQITNPSSPYCTIPSSSVNRKQ